MNPEDFKGEINKTIFALQELLTVKSQEYWRNNNPFHNFETGAMMSGQSPEKVLYGFLLKHLISFQDIVNDIENGLYPNDKVLDEKVQDIIVYLMVFQQMSKYHKFHVENKTES